MRFIGRWLARILLGANAVLAVLLLLSAYSPHVDPQTHPVWACMGLAFPVFLMPNVLFLLFWLVVYRRYALLPIMVLIVCWGSIRTYFPVNLFQSDAPDGAIKLVSYNTRAFGERASHTREKPNDVLAYLQQTDADIICLQEFNWGGKLKKKDIDYALRKYPYRHYRELAGGMNGLGCYSRYPILSATSIPYESKVNGSVAYRIKVEKDTLLVVNNHLESYKIGDSDVETYQSVIDAPSSWENSAGVRKLARKLIKGTKARSAQADAVAAVIAGFNGQGVVVCGDFNDSPISYAHRKLGEGLEDAFVHSGNGPGFSYVQNRFYFRIDHILTGKGVRSYQCLVNDTVKASDHYPIECRLAWE